MTDETLPAVFAGETRDHRRVEWSRGEWTGDRELIHEADARRGADPSMYAIAAAIAAVVGEGGNVSASITNLMGDKQ